MHVLTLKFLQEGKDDVVGDHHQHKNQSPGQVESLHWRQNVNVQVSIGFFDKVGNWETTRGERNSEEELTEVTRCLI